MRRTLKLNSGFNRRGANIGDICSLFPFPVSTVTTIVWSKDRYFDDGGYYGCILAMLFCYFKITEKLIANMWMKSL